ncbi:MAG: S1 RNA-binding domain-containing protein [Chloroflexi bacterium AL-W]|nr:S1 RNA-binding domain-containing protein [Chloroflexi bacterium AL-N1]NOK65679.1 S1 RNA-binding domain-containing protein [Chloroflexi bacterium AL-N10]NOK74380.1 S1 RNA-binding domain-containing protein [Chloroflexi bacterium AL-N5]NOK80712.1 S1 RNA-binding domain-containing protein [Chloroflexi bacterium AL-W]NOK88638.1 S1 RNA-binding domain-containing protein [Chloroflexi bacterium AL-N15]
MNPYSGQVDQEMEDLDWTQLLDDYDYTQPQRGELREGMVIRTEDNIILVSIGTKREGVIPHRDLQELDEEFVSAIKVGDSIQVYVDDPENRDGDLILSLTKVQIAKDWEEAAKLQEEGGIIQGTVTGYNKGGLLVQFNRIRGFVPASQVAQLHGRTAAEERQQALQRMVNQTIPLKVIEVDRDRNRLVLSERLATQDWRKAQKQRLLTELQPGDVLAGRVNQLTNFGAFIDLGGADGLAHISELSWQRVNHPREVLTPGQDLEVMVVEVDIERERIGLSIRRLQNNPWENIDQRYSLGQLVTGPITNVTPFGAFVQIEEAVEGLIHASELSSDPQVQPRDILQPGQEITAKIISLDTQRQRMGLSLRRTDEEGTEDTTPGIAEEIEALSESQEVDAPEEIEASSESQEVGAAQVTDISDTETATATDTVADTNGITPITENDITNEDDAAMPEAEKPAVV